MIDKIRIYLDTSIISYLDQQDMPERMKETQEVWKILKSNKFKNGYSIISNYYYIITRFWYIFCKRTF